MGWGGGRGRGRGEGVGGQFHDFQHSPITGLYFPKASANAPVIFLDGDPQMLVQCKKVWLDNSVIISPVDAHYWLKKPFMCTKPKRGFLLLHTQPTSRINKPEGNCFHYKICKGNLSE
jgi:hypothetical protein